MASMKRIEKFLLLDEQEKAPSPVDTKGDEKDSLEKHDSAPSADITLEAASFSWAADKPAFLGPLSVVLNPGHLHVCVGPVASVSRLFFIPITTLGLTQLCNPREKPCSFCLSSASRSSLAAS